MFITCVLQDIYIFNIRIFGKKIKIKTDQKRKSYFVVKEQKEQSRR